MSQGHWLGILVCGTVMSEKLPPFYIITVNYRSREQLREFLASLAPASLVRRCLIVNHSPEEDLADLAAPFPVQVISQANAGYGAGLNRGLREIPEPEAVALLANPDVALLTPAALTEALGYMAANSRVGCLIPHMVGAAGEALPVCRSFYSLRTLLASRLPFCRRLWPGAWHGHHYCDQDAAAPREVDWGAGAALLYRVATAAGRAAFDERFFLYFEDVDLCADLWRRGFTVMHYPSLIFRHEVQRQSTSSLRFLGYHLASLLKFIWKYRGLPSREDLVRRGP